MLLSRVAPFLLFASLARPSNGVEYSQDRALRMLTLTRTAYCQDLAAVRTWSCKLCSLYPTMTNVTTVHDSSLGMQLFVGVDPSDGVNGSVLVSFRGSEVLVNYLKDLEIAKSAPFMEGEGCDGCLVHQGMLDTWNSVRVATIAVIMGKLARYHGATLRITGHSMGASMSEVLCVDLKLHHRVECDQVYTFGTPRTGNRAFVEAFESAIPSRDVWRVTHWRDPVPHLPPAALGFAHSATEYFYNRDNTISRQCEGGEDPKCCQQFELAVCVACCVMEHLHYLNKTIGQATCDF